MHAARVVARQEAVIVSVTYELADAVDGQVEISDGANSAK
jgi:hypothetical protein